MTSAYQLVMSKNKPATCACGETYDAFRTNLTFGAVRDLLWNMEDPNRPGQFRQKGRHSVLGYWRELKIQMFYQAHGYCAVAFSEAA
jgi:hypothetical protein